MSNKLTCKNNHQRTTTNWIQSPSGRFFCKPCRDSRNAAYRSRNIDAIKEYRKSYYKNNVTSVLSKNKAYREYNKEKVSEINKGWARANQEKVRNYKRSWKKRNPLNSKAYKHRRRSSLKGDLFPTELWKEVLLLFNGWCPYCGVSGFELTVDHIVPISKGGTNNVSNLIPCCALCNSKKGNKDFEVWVAELEDN